MTTDAFQLDFQQLQGLVTKLESQLDQINQIRAKNSDATATRQIFLARATYNTTSTSFKQMERLVHVYKSDPTKHTSLSKQEKKKRSEKIAKELQKFEKLESYFKVLDPSSAGNSSGGYNLFPQDDNEALLHNDSRGEDGELESTRNQTNRQVTQDLRAQIEN